MTQTPQPLRAVAAAAAASITLLATGCGGGGTGAAADAVAVVAGAASAAAAAPAASAASAAAAAAPVTISGVAATGAPLAGASITVTDSTGARVCATTTAADGGYGCEIAAAAQAPFAVVAELDERRLYSTVASAAGGVANVTQLTTLIVARMTPGGDPAAFAQAIRSDPTLGHADKLKARTDEVRTLLAPLLGAIGDTTDPVQGRFVADGSGHDKALDALQVSIRPAETQSNIEVTVRTRPQSDSAEPVKIAFRSDDKAPPALAVAIDKDDLADNVLGMLNGLTGRFTACYAEPLAKRIAGVADGAVQATGGASAIAAQACRSLFVDDDPSKFLDNGLAVGSSGAFSGMFRDSATGARFDKFSFEYLWANGDMYVTFRSLTKAGVAANSAITVRRQGSHLKVVGNQYRFDAAVRPFAATRERLMQPHLNYLASGYNVSLPNRLDPQTQLPIFKEAIVTAPDGRKSLYRPLAGRSNLGVVESSGRQRGNSVQFFAARFIDPKATGTPQSRDGHDSSYFVESASTDDQALLALPDHGSWRVEWVHVDAAKANVVQAYRTLRRAPTLGELSRIQFADLAEPMRGELAARGQASGSAVIGFGTPTAARPNVFAYAPAAGGDGWFVPEGAVAPSSVSVYGSSGGGQSFNNVTSVSAADRKATVRCASQSAQDNHCDTSSGVTQFAEGSRITALELYARDARQLEIQRQVSLGLLAD